MNKKVYLKLKKINLKKNGRTMNLRYTLILVTRKTTHSIKGNSYLTKMSPKNNLVKFHRPVS